MSGRNPGLQKKETWGTPDLGHPPDTLGGIGIDDRGTCPYIKVRKGKEGEIYKMRPAIEELQAMGPFPSSDEVIRLKSVELVEKYEQLISSIKGPVTDDEAKGLTQIFNDDDFFGLCWTLVSLIETAPNWPFDECLEDSSNQWIRRLKDRASRWRAAGFPARPFYTEFGLPDPKSKQPS